MHRALPMTAVLVGTLAPASGAANGQSTHLWISEHALTEHLPEGPLRDLLMAQRRQLDNGTMFPDGGYPLGDPYAEIAHWEPFQGAYLDWIMLEHGAPYSASGAAHLAFVLGMNSHGMADQVFDSLYMERVKRFDGDSDELDTTSDIVFASLVGPRVVPEDWLPSDVFVTLYDEVAGYPVDPSQMDLGQSLLRFAVEAVNNGSMDAQAVQDASDRYPWGNSHLLDDAVPGAPPCEGEVIARYWQSQWELAHDRALYRPVLTTHPRDGAANHETASSSIDSWVTIVFARGLDAASVTPGHFELKAEGGASIPFDVNVFYGQDSHVVHLKPTADFAAGTVYVVTVAAGVPTIHGESLDGWSFRFSTGATPPEPVNPAWGEGLSGDGDGDGDGGTESESETGAPATDGPGSGCACATDSNDDGALPLAFFGLWAARRRSPRRNRRPD